MRTLYVHIVATFIVITLVSGLCALMLTNVYYLSKMRDYNEQKTLRIAQEIRDLYESSSDFDFENYLSSIANMGFQLYAIDEHGEGSYYGAAFKHTELEAKHIAEVLKGQTYQGMQGEDRFLNVAGFFENSLRNSVGLPVEVLGQNYALFIRPNLEQQIGEVRMILAILLVCSFLFSVVLIIFLTRFLVSPLKKLTEATNRIVAGDYNNIQLEVKRKDEIGNLARHFDQMAQSLKRLDQMRQEFVANVSHEIQSPLTSIQGFAYSMLKKKATPEEETKYLQTIYEESKRLSSLSNQLLTLASLDKETNVLKKSAFRLDEQIRQVLITLEWQWTQKNLTVEADLSEIVATADPELLYQVWLNLMTNSIKFSQPGATLHIELKVEQEIKVVIRDEGIGISQEEIPFIFDRFYKADKARNRTTAGSGLGLAIVKKIMDLHEGSIDVTSELGKGTTFTLRFPYL
ncbi:sensor histidine kinase [Caldalkalibacillus mannanilyticus]|uniref:sensor histidine kinase n=1 Tax=Caldalkalibacillus mannanilyticus TaxID=1418 RepID=UPI000468D5EC|nr:HAMP domain-containing sensor histidine kinase [Caldalkalibacillus mannanilyticus]